MGLRRTLSNPVTAAGFTGTVAAVISAVITFATTGTFTVNDVQQLGLLGFAGLVIGYGIGVMNKPRDPFADEDTPKKERVKKEKKQEPKEEAAPQKSAKEVFNSADLASISGGTDPRPKRLHINTAPSAASESEIDKLAKMVEMQYDEEFEERDPDKPKKVTIGGAGTLPPAVSSLSLDRQFYTNSETVWQREPWKHISGFTFKTEEQKQVMRELYEAVKTQRPTPQQEVELAKFDLANVQQWKVRGTDFITGDSPEEGWAAYAHPGSFRGLLQLIRQEQFPPAACKLLGYWVALTEPKALSELQPFFENAANRSAAQVILRHYLDKVTGSWLKLSEKDFKKLVGMLYTHRLENGEKFEAESLEAMVCEKFPHWNFSTLFAA